jgi:hypothetical protein
MNPYVFIVGCPRSGTTLLRRMVDAHPELAIIHETQWIPRWFERRIGVTPDGYATSELVDRLLEFPRFTELKIGRERLEQLLGLNGQVPYSTFVTGIFDLYGEDQGKRLVGEKSPGYVRRLPTLHALWPGARYVHLIRDGRDVCLSVLNWKKADRVARHFEIWNEDRVATLALWWEWHVRLGREMGASLGPDLYSEIRYERLVTDPAGESAALCAFLALPYAESIVHYQVGRERRNWGRSAKGRWLPPTPGLRDWRSEMPVGDVERFEAVAGDLLDEIGCERRFLRPSRSAIRGIGELRERFANDVRRRAGQLPERWRDSE